MSLLLPIQSMKQTIDTQDSMFCFKSGRLLFFLHKQIAQHLCSFFRRNKRFICLRLLLYLKLPTSSKNVLAKIEFRTQRTITFALNSERLVGGSPMSHLPGKMRASGWITNLTFQTMQFNGKSNQSRRWRVIQTVTWNVVIRRTTAANM